VVTFRPTRAQALSHGAYLGGLIGVAAAMGALALAATGVPARLGLESWLVVAGPLVGLVAGALAGLAFGRDGRVDIDDLGIHPRSAGATVAWQRVADLRAERRGGRTQIAVYLDAGQIARLRAPYDGKFLAGDPQFERKLFMLRNLWETHRTFTLRTPEVPPTAAEADRPRAGNIGRPRQDSPG
jgi:hypothetical protein